jgi:hypothetical protein
MKTIKIKTLNRSTKNRVTRAENIYQVIQKLTDPSINNKNQSNTMYEKNKNMSTNHNDVESIKLLFICTASLIIQELVFGK